MNCQRRSSRKDPKEESEKETETQGGKQRGSLSKLSNLPCLELKKSSVTELCYAGAEHDFGKSDDQ